MPPQGPLTGASATAATFAGAGYVKVPAGLLHASTTRAVSLWFKTSKKGVLIGDQSRSVTGATAAAGTWTPVLHVGSDGKLHGHWWSVSGSGSTDFGSTGTVTDNAWHYAVLSCDVDSQALFLDGTKQDTFSGTPADQSNTLTYIGAGPRTSTTRTATSPSRPHPSAWSPTTPTTRRAGSSPNSTRPPPTP
ncbi:LamG-like jellyroll fold domain-containing protein [Streptomyces sp. NPDC094038]|uniref:LamG-like jellyroll fold domain-containing protein n=1 Tax=Streptomyces sp. NPDC094038 TaxID=3366055 RepID=UPI0037F4F6A8